MILPTCHDHLILGLALFTRPVWDQKYLLFESLVLSAILAAAPIFTLVLILGVMRKAAWIAGLSGLAVTFVLAIAAYRMPVLPAVSAAANGAAFGLFPISWIVLWAITLYRVTVETGKFEMIKDSLGRLTAEPYMQVLLIAFAFGAFIEGAAGFGTPVAIAAAMLVGLGFSAYRASAVCLLANTAPVAFGSIGIPVVTLAGITGLPLDRLTAVAGRVCAPMSFLVPGYLIFAMGGWTALRSVWPGALIAGSAFASVQLLVSNYVGPQLTDILASLSAIIALIIMLRLQRVRRSASAEETGVTPLVNHTVARTSDSNQAVNSAIALETRPQDEMKLSDSAYAWLPYGFLVLCVLLWGTRPIQLWLGKAGVSFAWPFLHDLVRRMPPIVAAPSPYHAVFNVNWLSASGTSCMVATLLSVLFLRMSIRSFIRLLLSVVLQLFLPTVTVTSVLAIAFLMNYCGATATLGLAFAATSKLFPFFSALLGWLGVFLTGSDTSSNALFGNLQVVTATRLGLDPFLMAASNSIGGVMGKMISLQTIAVAAAATGMSVSDQARLFRFTFKHSIVLATLVGIIVMIYAYASHS